MTHMINSVVADAGINPEHVEHAQRDAFAL
jgi:hypothetical protein